MADSDLLTAMRIQTGETFTAPEVIGDYDFSSE
jgi:hypothetical protein